MIVSIFFDYKLNNDDVAYKFLNVGLDCIDCGMSSDSYGILLEFAMNKLLYEHGYSDKLLMELIIVKYFIPIVQERNINKFHDAIISSFRSNRINETISHLSWLIG